MVGVARFVSPGLLWPGGPPYRHVGPTHGRKRIVGYTPWAASLKVPPPAQSDLQPQLAPKEHRNQRTHEKCKIDKRSRLQADALIEPEPVL